MDVSYPLAPNPIFASVQGEGALLGVPMIFVRLAGCSIGCPLCDTDYRKTSRATAKEIVERIGPIYSNEQWAWLTGGEPTDHDLEPLIAELHSYGFSVALATAGHRQAYGIAKVDWLSVSPHDPKAWRIKRGDELKLVPGLNGHSLAAFAGKLHKFRHRYVSPCYGKPETIAECLEFVRANPLWRMTTQAQKVWGLS